MIAAQSIETIFDAYLRNPALEYVYAAKLSGRTSFVELDLPDRDQLSPHLIEKIEAGLNTTVAARWRRNLTSVPSKAPKNGGF